MGRYTFLVCTTTMLLLMSPIGCASGLKIKIYYSMPSLGGIYRKQSKELVEYAKTEGFRCVSPSDWEAVLNLVKSCQQR